MSEAAVDNRPAPTAHPGPAAPPEAGPGSLPGPRGSVARPLSPALGMEVRGFDAGQALDDELFDAVVDLWHRANGLLVLRDQDLTPEQHIAFSRRFGELHTLQNHTVTKYLLDGHPEIYRVSNKKSADGTPLGRKGAGTYWHSDQSYEERPAKASILYALEIPPYGGDTMFASMYHAYDGLSPAMQRFLQGLSAVHDFAVASGGGFRHETVTKEQLEAAPPRTHPVVRTHPGTGRKALFVNPGFTSHLEGLEAAESRAILDFLFAHSVRPEFVYRHRWSPRDLVIWDNRCTMHYAVADYDTVGDRYMHRCTVIGEVPA
jgi:taurine dioxygenase